MKKKITLIFILLLLISMPICTAKVWISPMKMTAYANVSILGSTDVEKCFILRNDANNSAIVEINATGLDITYKEFEGNEIELGAGEKIIIHPTIKVEKGRHEGFIKITGLEKNDVGGTGSHVVSTMSITVTTIGETVYPWTLLIVISFVLICGVGYLIYRKKKK